MQSVAEAESLIAGALPLPQMETVELARSPGRVLAAEIVADRDQPPFDRVAMDGIAIAAADWAAGDRAFSLAGIQRAGQSPLSLVGRGRAIEVMTGAQLPLGADSVIQYEALSLAGNQAEISGGSNWQFRPGMNVHRQGSDYAASQKLLQAGLRIGAAEIQLLATIGQAQVGVYRQPRIAIISTGDELVGIGEKPLPWQIRLSNSPSIAAELSLWGYPPPQEIACGDNQAAIELAIRGCLESADVLILTGGVSKGKYDCVPEVLAGLGVRRIFRQVRQKPGKPLWFGAGPKGVLVFALPGNPVAALTCARRFVVPAIAAMEGATIKPIYLPLMKDFTKEAGNAWFPTAQLVSPEGGLGIEIMPMLGSGNFYQLSGSSGFVELGAEAKNFPRGSLVPFYPWGNYGLCVSS